MRRTRDTLTWVLLLTAVPTVAYLAMAPDVEASLGIPACAGLAHVGPCRLCPPEGRSRLPGVIDADNVRFVRSSESL